MVVVGYDARNVNLVIDALQLKAVAGLLNMSLPSQFNEVAKDLEKDGFTLTDKDVEHYARDFTLILRRLLKSVSIKPEDGVCPECGSDHEQEIEQELSPEVPQVQAKKKKKTPTVQ